MADQKTIEQRVKEIIVNQLNVNEEQITPTASFLDDLGADSLDTVELIMAFEEEFKDEIKGEIPESDAENSRQLARSSSTSKPRPAKPESPFVKSLAFCLFPRGNFSRTPFLSPEVGP